jgi:hypothetical protein
MKGVDGEVGIVGLAGTWSVDDSEGGVSSYSTLVCERCANDGVDMSLVMCAGLRY